MAICRLTRNYKGGTIDITIHEILQDMSIKELYKATGGPWGGIAVDKEFEHMLSAVIGDDEVYKSIIRECAFDHQTQMNSFEIAKREASHDNDDDIGFLIPQCYPIQLQHISGQTLASRIENSKYKGHIRVNKYGRLILTAVIVRSFFKEPIENIVNHIGHLFDMPEVRGTDALLLVGGFSESLLLPHAVKSYFNDKFGDVFKVFVPPNPELAIVKGAVQFGFNPENVRERIAPYTYGVKMVKKCARNAHEEEKCQKLLHKNYYYCENLFTTLVRKDEVVHYGRVVKYNHTLTTISSTTVKPKEVRTVPILIYACSDVGIIYVNEESCEKRGTLSLKLSELKKEQEIELRFMFSDSEITVNALDKLTGGEVETTLDFN